MNKQLKFKTGDRVKRPIDPYVKYEDWKYKYGTVITVYSKSGRFGHYPELYAVLWDEPKDTHPESRIKEGYLPHGLYKSEDS